jgi:hypothetical protein
MTTYYHYSKDGALQHSSNEVPLAHLGPACGDLSYYWQRGDVVGAYLAQRHMISPATNSAGSYYDSLQEAAYAELPNGHNGLQQSSPPHQFQQENASLTSKQHVYPDPEDIRHLHTLQSLSAHIDPARRLTALGGPVMNIVEEETGIILAHDVPKKMLVLFFGRRRVIDFIETIDMRSDPRFPDYEKV